jgi:hypothetical protein
VSTVHLRALPYDAKQKTNILNNIAKDTTNSGNILCSGEEILNLLSQKNTNEPIKTQIDNIKLLQLSRKLIYLYADEDDGTVKYMDPKTESINDKFNNNNTKIQNTVKYVVYAYKQAPQPKSLIIGRDRELLPTGIKNIGKTSQINPDPKHTGNTSNNESDAARKSVEAIVLHLTTKFGDEFKKKLGYLYYTIGGSNSISPIEISNETIIAHITNLLPNVTQNTINRISIDKQKNYPALVCRIIEDRKLPLHQNAAIYIRIDGQNYIIVKSNIYNSPMLVSFATDIKDLAIGMETAMRKLGNHNYTDIKYIYGVV